MMCLTHRFTPIGDLVRRTVRTIPLMYFVIYWLDIKRSCLMKGRLVIRNKLILLMEKESRITRIEDMLTILVLDTNVPTRKLSWSLESHRTLRNIERRRLVDTVGRLVMFRIVGKGVFPWKRRLKFLKEMWKLHIRLVSQPMTSPSMSELPKDC